MCLRVLSSFLFFLTRNNIMSFSEYTRILVGGGDTTPAKNIVKLSNVMSRIQSIISLLCTLYWIKSILRLE